MKSLSATVLLVLSGSALALTPQDQFAKELEGNSQTFLLRNDRPEPMPLDKSYVGKRVICFRNSNDRYFPYTIEWEDFEGLFTASILCQDGRLYFFRGEI